MPFVPTNEQAEILRHPSNRHARILAGPGTGKSATVIEWISRNPNVRAKLLTFTRAATAELVGKLTNREDIALDKPSTIHAFCIAVLLENGGVGEFPRPFRMADDWETDVIVEGSLARRLHIDKRDVGDLFSELAANWESLVPEEIAEVEPAERAQFMGGWREHREILGYTLLSELPYALRSALQDHPDLTGVDHQVLLVDEYQDLNACDLEVLRLISGRGSAIIAAGDDEQSIYSFRKAHPAGIRRFLEDYAGAADYPLTITRRCARRIVEWANYVIQGDPDREAARGALTAADRATDGEVALLGFPGHVAEARGVGRLVQHLMVDKHVPAEEILVLLRSDHNGQFSRPIKDELEGRGIAYSDPNDMKAILAEPTNRKAISLLRLAVNREDSLAWASLFFLTQGIGNTFFDYIYERARASRVTFGHALVDAYGAGFPGLSTALKGRSTAATRGIVEAVESIKVPDAKPEDGWSTFIFALNGGQFTITDSFRELLKKIDERAEPDIDFDRYLGQITPIAKDIALEKNDAVRIMTLAGSKGLTVKATIIVGLETGIIPMDHRDLAEERRLLYVGMTRAEQFLFGTWARVRRGPTARAGRDLVNQRRQLSTFVEGGPVPSTDGNGYLDEVSSV
ncbi:MAG: ATP-dependent helicase [Patescibacteria group bacterium]